MPTEDSRFEDFKSSRGEITECHLGLTLWNFSHENDGRVARDVQNIALNVLAYV